MISEFDPTASYESLYDICVVGTGPAGLTLALELADRGFNILLLEGGGLDYSDRSQDFYGCESVGHEGWPKFSRLRYFGGTSNHWSGRCRPFEPSDFERKSMNGLPGWPISYSSLEKYLSASMKIIDLDETLGFRPINADLLTDHFYPDSSMQSPPTRFSEKYLDTIRNHEKIQCLYNATAVNLSLNDSHSSTDSILVSDYNGRRSEFKAGKFILCLGGIETPRFLLNCNKQLEKGIGNKHDMVGRCFMEHLNVPPGTFIYNNPDDFLRMEFYTDTNFSNGLDIGNSNISLGIVQKVKSWGRTKAIKTFFKNISCKLDISEKVRFISDFKCPGMGKITTLMEQSPNLNSRIMLSKETDNMGLRRVKFDWQINDYDRRTIEAVAFEFSKQFSKSQLGKVKLNDAIIAGSEPMKIDFGRHSHHMGTTRMSKSAYYGVVDENCKVHDLDNLYIAGSSVFPTGGACNPTMPIIQISLRLVEHISALNRGSC